MSKKVSTIASACGIEIYLAGKLRILALLCCFAKATISLFQQRAALISWCLFAVIAAPFPEPHIMIPKSESPVATDSATG